MKKVVYRVEDDMDRQDILCTTYQMRNFYRQFGDGFFSTLDAMNYIQHHQIASWCKKNHHVLDVCCGRGLMLPLLRYLKKDIASYTGVDIEPKNARYLTHRVTDNKPIEDQYYPFEVNFVESDVSEMGKCFDKSFDVIIYTSSIEHMHKDHGSHSLVECRKIISNSGTMILTCPNTPENKDGYDTQYKAHVYEWKRSELIEELTVAGFRVVSEYGLLHDKKTLLKELRKHEFGNQFHYLSQFVPNEWLIPVFSPLFPKSAKEIGMICKPV